MHWSKKIRSFFHGMEYIILLLLVLAVWTILEKRGSLNTVIMPAPSKILSTFISLVKSGQLWKNLTISLLRVLKGYLLAASLGVILGILIGLFRHLNRLTDLLIQIIKPIPPIAWIPLVILWFGIGEEGKVFLIFLGYFLAFLVSGALRGL